MSYPGGKDGAGVWQKIISHIPRHRVLVELFGGSAAVTRHILPAERNIVVEVDAAVIAGEGDKIRRACPTVELINEHAFRFVETAPIEDDWCAYFDPPYHPSTLKSRERYEHVLTAEEHDVMLGLAVKLPCAVLISGYRCESYDRMLSDWYRLDYICGTRGGPAVESLWSNRGVPEWPHDGRFVGEDFRERETRSRRRETIQRRAAAVDPAELLTMAEDIACSIADRGGEVLLEEVLTGIRNRRQWRAKQLGRVNER